MKRRTKLFIVIAVFVLIAFVLVLWLVWPKRQLVAQHISYETFVQKEKEGKIRAVYFHSEDEKLYGLYEGSVYALDQLPKAYDFVVEDADKTILMESLLTKLNQESDDDFGIILQQSPNKNR